MKKQSPTFFILLLRPRESSRLHVQARRTDGDDVVEDVQTRSNKSKRVSAECFQLVVYDVLDISTQINTSRVWNFWTHLTGRRKHSQTKPLGAQATSLAGESEACTCWDIQSPAKHPMHGKQIEITWNNMKYHEITWNHDLKDDSSKRSETWQASSRKGGQMAQYFHILPSRCYRPKQSQHISQDRFIQGLFLGNGTPLHRRSTGWSSNSSASSSNLMRLILKSSLHSWRYLKLKMF